jgi:transposase
MSRGKRSKRAKQRGTRSTRPVVDLTLDEVGAILEQAKSSPLTADGYAKLKAAMDTLAFLTRELQAKSTSLERLRRMLFGAKTEKTSGLFGKDGESGEGAPARRPDAGSDEPESIAKRAGHGRNSASAYTGASKVKVPHPTLHSGDGCPGCEKGKVYPLAEPGVLVRITGMAPLGAKVYECDRWRCNLCGDVFTAPAPDGVGQEKYDETAMSMIGLLKYGAGLPFNRIEKLQEGMGIPMPAATQWELVKGAAGRLAPVHQELIGQAAQGKVLYNDDTTMKVLELTGEQRAAAATDEETDERTGVFTSGIVSTNEDHRIALFFTGVQHAGENLADVLAKRGAELPKPIQMCDALPTNTAGDFETLLAGCNSHARRRYVDVAEDFPEECRYVLETLRDVYKNDALTRAQGMSPEQRLSFHQAESRPLLDSLETWMRQQFDEHKVEPNSGLGDAIRYMQKHWSKLTLFLHEAGAPLDNNICERALKKSILHRKNALFYKTLNGARVGDTFMSIIHTAELSNVAPFDYLVALLRHHQEAADAPADWMPWNYRDSLARLRAETPLS